jgi:hypothetical protein
MLNPTLVTRIKKRRQLACVGVKRSNITALVTITFKTGESQICFGRFPTMFTGDHMIYFVGKE